MGPDGGGVGAMVSLGGTGLAGAVGIGNGAAKDSSRDRGCWNRLSACDCGWFGLCSNIRSPLWRR